MPCIPAQSRAPTCPQPRAMAPLGPGLGSGPSCPPQSPGASPPHPKTGSEGAASPRLPPPAPTGAPRRGRGGAPRAAAAPLPSRGRKGKGRGGPRRHGGWGAIRGLGWGISWFWRSFLGEIWPATAPCLPHGGKEQGLRHPRHLVPWARSLLAPPAL